MFSALSQKHCHCMPVSLTHRTLISTGGKVGKGVKLHPRFIRLAMGLAHSVRIKKLSADIRVSPQEAFCGPGRCWERRNQQQDIVASMINMGSG